MIATLRFAWLASLPAVASFLPAQGNGFIEPRPAMSTARQELGAAEILGTVYVAGGLDSRRNPVSSMERFDSLRGWSSVASMPTTLHHFGMAQVRGSIYAVGGYVSSFTGTSAVHRYSPSGDTWRTVAPLPQPRGALVAVALGGELYAIGGVHPVRGVVRDVTRYDPVANSWTPVAPMLFAREHLAAAALDGRIYVAGGRLGFGSELRTAEVYDPATNTWTRLPDMPVAHGGTGAAVLHGKLLVFGGEGPGGNVAEIDEYDPATNSWRRVTDLSPAVHGIYPVTQTLGDEIVIAGGATSPGFAAIGSVQAFRYLPDGVSSFGPSTSCPSLGPIRLGTTARPVANTPGFGFVVSDNLPSGTAGFLGLTATPVLRGLAVAGALVFVPLDPATVIVPATSGAPFAAIGGPVPPSLAGLRFFAQTGWLPPNPCSAPLLTSDAISMIFR